MDLFVARQPIFNRRQQVVAYELLFRAGPENCFVQAGESYSTSRVLSSQFVAGLEHLTEGKPAFVNFSRESLVEDFAFVLPPDALVVEILETVEPDAEVLAACQRLRAAGYRIALDDYVAGPRTAPLLPFASIVKVDLLSEQKTPKALAADLQALPCQLLAEKVESREVHAAALEADYHLFQGFFFSRPTIHATRTIPGFRLNYLRLLRALNDPSSTIARLEEIVKQEASLTYRFLKRVNSGLYGFRTEIQSLRHALVLLGEREIRSCATVWTMAELGRDQPAELVVSATIRGRFLELLGAHAGLGPRASDLFLLGMFSLLDAIVQRPLAELVETLPLASDVRAALLGEVNGLRHLLAVAICQERANWTGLQACAAEAGLDQAAIPGCYLEAVRWVSDAFAGFAFRETAP